MGESKKTAMRPLVNEIWQQYQNGDLTLNEARERIVKAAGGFQKPIWAKERANAVSNAGGNEAGQSPANTGELPVLDVRGTTPGNSGPGSGSQPAATVPTAGAAEGTKGGLTDRAKDWITRHKPEMTPDGKMVVYHATTEAGAKAIRESGQFNPKTFFSEDSAYPEGSSEQRGKGKNPVVLKVLVDPTDMHLGVHIQGREGVPIPLVEAASPLNNALEGIRKGKGVKKAKGAVPAARRIL
jgi:hypothetical protein